MSEALRLIVSFGWKPAAVAPLRVACVDPGWTTPLSSRERPGDKTAARRGRPGCARAGGLSPVPAVVHCAECKRFGRGGNPHRRRGRGGRRCCGRAGRAEGIILLLLLAR